VVAGIFVATLANHAIAAWLGAGIAEWLGREALRWILGLSFLAMAGWTLIPDRIDADEKSTSRFGAFGTTLIAFFLVEIGDKTQIATIALAANYASVVAVVAGTTLGMMIADVPAVYLGERILRRIPMRLLQRIAAAAFAVLGILVLLA
jgi:putative Ca2+/H+ antiporter (TMEM165/GDT1 family)